jgi:hypothetical protein
MNAHQVAIAAGADRKWLLNSAAILRRPLRYSRSEARWWGLVKHLSQTLEVSLGTAARMATASLDRHKTKRAIRPDPTETVTLRVDIERYSSIFVGNLSRALARETPKRRGRRTPVRKGRDAIAAARNYGVDIGLLQSSLARTPAERLAIADTNARFVREMRSNRK